MSYIYRRKHVSCGGFTLPLTGAKLPWYTVLWLMIHLEHED